MKRFHVHAHVENLAKSVAFYSQLFAAEPTRAKLAATCEAVLRIHDVWRQFDLPNQPETHVSLEDYTAVLDKLVAQTVPLVKGLVLMTPFYVESNRADAMRLRMDEYGAAVKSIASKHGVLCVDTQAAFDVLLAHLYPATLAWDRVHISQTGHMVIARAFLNAVEMPGIS